MQSLQFLALQHSGNWGMDHWMRYDTFHTNYWKGYTESLKHWRWSRWNDDDPFLDDYIGHPIMGAITSYIYVQNDPRGKTLPFENSKSYWASRGRAFLWSAIYSAQWKIGPASEASLEKVGGFRYQDHSSGKLTNGSGVVDFVMTPVGGTAWQVGEDALDRFVISRLENATKNPLWLVAVSFLNPCRSAANILRLRAPWFRDSRTVTASWTSHSTR